MRQQGYKLNNHSVGDSEELRTLAIERVVLDILETTRTVLATMMNERDRAGDSEK